MANRRPDTTNAAAKRKMKTLRPRVKKAEEAEEFDRFGVLLEEAQKFCEGVGLHKDLIGEILKTDSDWAFILKVDALLESAAKQILRHGLRFKILNRIIQNETLDEFVDSLPMAGRTSILKLLHAACLPPEELACVETIRKVRNAYAHNIKFADVSLIELVKQRNDKSQLIKHLSAIETYDEANLIASYEKDPKFLRFCIIDSTMRFLFYAYHMAVKFGAKGDSRRPTGLGKSGA
jgi:hypothetical protein